AGAPGGRWARCSSPSPRPRAPPRAATCSRARAGSSASARRRPPSISRGARSRACRSTREPTEVRIFLGVFPPPPVQGVLHAAAEPLRRAGAAVSWVKAENLHYTMRFIGEVGEDGARRVAEAADEAAADCRTFEAEAGEFGAFPSPRRARVLWIGLARGGEELVALAGTLARALERRGFGKPDQPFAAHLTLGRVRRGTAGRSRPPAA